MVMDTNPLHVKTGVTLNDKDEQARKAVKVFRGLQPTLTAYARILTKRTDVRVEMAAADNGSTDGKRIFFRPPLALGDNTPHVRSLCDKRDDEMQQRCAACKIREGVLVTIYHEIAHICYDSFAPPSANDLSATVERAVAEHGSKYADKLKQRLDRIPPYRKQSFKGIADAISPYLPILVNALEDARVNSAQFKARVGTKVMFEAHEREIFLKGVEQLDRTTGETIVVKWNTYPLNMQVIVGLFCKASGYDYSDFFAPQVVRTLDDETLTKLINQMATVRNAAGVYHLSFPILARLRELGYCKSELDPEPEPEEQPEEQPDEQDPDTEENKDESSEEEDGDSGDTGDSSDDGSPDSSDEDADSQSEGDDGKGEPSDSRDGSDEDEQSDGGSQDVQQDDTDGSEGGSQDGDADEADGDSDQEGAGSGSPSDDTDEPGESGSDGGSDDAESEGAGAPSDGAGDREGGSDEGQPSEEAAGDEGNAGDGRKDGPEGQDQGGAVDGEGDDADTVDQEGSAGGQGGSRGEGGPADDDDADSDRSGDRELGSDDEEKDAVDADGNRDDASEGAGSSAGEGGDRDSGDGPDGQDPVEATGDEGSPELERGSGDAAASGDRLPTEAGDEAGEDDADSSGSEDGTEASDAGSDGPAAGDGEPVDSGADDGTGGAELIEDPKIEHGDDPEAINLAVLEWMEHAEKPKTVQEQEQADKDAVDIAIVQGLYFETPSKNVLAVREHRWGEPVMVNGVNSSIAWSHAHWHRLHNYREALGIEGDFSTPESILGPALLRARVAFSENARGKDQRHLKGGKVDPSVLGRRAFHGDERIFKRRIMPGKRNYFVLIGMDVSGSTIGQNILIEKQAVMAQARLLDRLGVQFAIYAHTGNWADPSMRRTEGIALDIFLVKEPHEVWNGKIEERLMELGPASTNIDGHTLEYYRKVLDKVDATDKIILYYTDGKMPAENHDEELEILQREIKICKKKNYTLLGVGIRTDSPVKHGLDTVQIDTPDEIVKVVKHLEKRLLQR